MKVLTCIPHFYDRSKSMHGVMGSSQDSPESRARMIDGCLRQLMGTLSPQRFFLGTSGEGQSLVVNNEVTASANPIAGDVCVITHGDNHLLSLVSAKGYIHVDANLRNPTLLPYACRAVFADRRSDYDAFFYIEDDTVPLDSAFFAKLAAFHAAHGEGKILLPNRYELFGHLSAKAYLEQPSPPKYQVKANSDSEEVLTLPSFSDQVRFDLTRSWGAGCFFVTRAQLNAWMKFADFHRPNPDMDIMVMEQAMLPMLGRYPMYKPGVQNMDFLEVHHVPNRACHARTPFNKIVSILQRS